MILSASRSISRTGLENRTIWLVAIIGLTLSFTAQLMIRQQLEAHKMLDFEWVAHNRIRALNYGIDNSMLAVATIRDHVVASGDVNEEGFQLFAKSLLDRHQGIQSLLWVPRLKASERAAFEASAAEGRGGYQLSERGGHYELIPAGERAEYFPVLYMASNQGDEIPTGFDLGSNPRFAETLSRARDQGQVAVSGRIGYPLPQGGLEYGFMVASPVFDKSTTEKQAVTLSGFVVGFFRLGNLTNAAISLLEPRGVEILILDESAPADERFLHFYTSRLAPSSIGQDDYDGWQSDRDEPKFEEYIQVADRRLAIICGRTDLFRSAEAFEESPWVVLIAGLVFTILLSFYLARIRENIRQRSAMEQQLVEREELFRQMTETVDEGFWAKAVNGLELLYLSPAYRKILGITKGEGRPSLLDATYPEDRPMLAEALQRTGREGADTEVLHRILRADGMLRWVRTRGFAVHDEDHRIYRLVGFIEDVTEHKLAEEALRESEAKLRDLFQQSPDIIMTVDIKGKILLMNRYIPALPAERAVGHNSLALMPRDFRKWFRKALKKVFRWKNRPCAMLAWPPSECWPPVWPTRSTTPTMPYSSTRPWSHGRGGTSLPYCRSTSRSMATSLWAGCLFPRRMITSPACCPRLPTTRTGSAASWKISSTCPGRMPAGLPRTWIYSRSWKPRSWSCTTKFRNLPMSVPWTCLTACPGCGAIPSSWSRYSSMSC